MVTLETLEALVDGVGQEGQDLMASQAVLDGGDVMGSLGELDLR